MREDITKKKEDGCKYQISSVEKKDTEEHLLQACVEHDKILRENFLQPPTSLCKNYY